MILKRCVYGVDKNPMAVELAKVALWLHTFTVGAPLSFLDHHLRAGDSLFGNTVYSAVAKAQSFGGGLLLHDSITEATSSAAAMQVIEGLTDAEIAEAHRSKDMFEGIKLKVAPLDAFMKLMHAFDWLNLKTKADKAALQAFFDGQFGDPMAVARGRVKISTKRPEGARFAEILAEALALIAEENFLNWQVAFPGIWEHWQSAEPTGGFDAVIGNPPWDRMKLQQVEWFAARRPEIALAQRASDRTRMIKKLEKDGDPLFADYKKAEKRAIDSARMASKGGDFPLLSGGDINLYSLFVERAMGLVNNRGMVGLLVPSGIASDKTSSKFFKGVATEGRLKALYDFENRRTQYGVAPFFPDVDSRFKFCAFIASPSIIAGKARCGFFFQDITEINDPERCFTLSADDFARVNPNTGTAPIFRTRRDAELTRQIYAAAPVLVNRAGDSEVRTWPVKYSRMLDMTNDSGLFRTKTELEEVEKAYPLGGNIWRSEAGDWVPLYTGRMIHQFDHRAASVVTNEANIHNAALSGEVTLAEKSNPDFVPTPQFWILDKEVDLPPSVNWVISFRDIARATDARTMISAGAPRVGFGNTAPLMVVEETNQPRAIQCLIGNLGAIVLDYTVRQKAQSTHLNWYIVEQLPVISPDRYETVKFGAKTAGEIVKAHVLELTYTAHDMAPFARDMGYVDDAGEVKPPFIWDEMRRLHLRARLDALYFILYGITDRDDVRYIYSTFPIVQRQEEKEHGRYLSRDLCLAYMNALENGDSDTTVAV